MNLYLRDYAFLGHFPLALGMMVSKRKSLASIPSWPHPQPIIRNSLEEVAGTLRFMADRMVIIAHYPEEELPGVKNDLFLLSADGVSQLQ